jgi:hypothetical protein
VLYCLLHSECIWLTLSFLIECLFLDANAINYIIDMLRLSITNMSLTIEICVDYLDRLDAVFLRLKKKRS